MKRTQLASALALIGVGALGSYLTIAGLPLSAGGFELTEVGQSAEHASVNATTHHLAQEVAALKAEVTRLAAAQRHSDTDALAALRRQIHDLRDALAAMQSIRQQDMAMRQPAEDYAANRVSEFDLDHMAAEQAERDARQRAQLEAQFASEQEDPWWSSATTEVIHAAMADGALGGLDYGEVECRSAMCRMRVDGLTPEQQTALELYFPMQVGEALPKINYQQQENIDGTMSVVMYLAREPDAF